MPTLWAKSTYRHEIDIDDTATGDALPLDGAAIEYRMLTDWPKNDPDLIVGYDEDDDEVDVEPDDETGRVVVTVPAEDIPAGKHVEELRVSFPDDPDQSSRVVLQESERFRHAFTDPPTAE